MINNPSHEQSQIIAAVANNQHVMCSSVAGAGKTTTVLFIAKNLKHKNILQVTYNRALKIEVDAKREKANLHNLTIKTFNGLAYEYYSRIGFTDVGVKQIIEHDLPLINDYSYDIIIIDECQDMTGILYQLMKKYLYDMPKKSPPILVIIGDHNQAVYEFKGADKRYLTLANEIWFKKNYTALYLRTSYRVTRQIATFINTFMLKEQRILACRDGPPVDYIIKGAWDGVAEIFKIIDATLKDLSSQIYPGDIFILMPSVRVMKSKHSPAANLENKLVLANYSVFVPLTDDSNINDSVTEGKILFSTFHQAKGRERKMVIILGFDNSYFKFYARDSNPLKCPETLYVAATRAIQRLIILDSPYVYGPLPFLDQYKHIGNKKVTCVNLIGSNYQHNIAHTAAETFSMTTVVDLVRHISESNLLEITKIVDDNVFIKTTVENATTITMVSEYFKEEVCDLTGIAIPAIHEYLASKENKRCKILDSLDFSGDDDKLINIDLSFNDNPKTIKDFLRIATLYHYKTTGLLFKVKQIPTSYNWVSKEETAKFLKNMEHIKIPANYEVAIGNTYDDKNRSCYIYNYEGRIIKIYGIVDLINADALYEIKCVNELTIEHKMQLIVYCYIWINSYNYNKNRNFKLLNIRTGECYTINLTVETVEKIERIVGLLIKNKYTNKNKLTDEEFIVGSQATPHPRGGTT